MLTAWKLAPALAAGCTVVIKPSEFTSASLLEFMKLVSRRRAFRGRRQRRHRLWRRVGEPLVDASASREGRFHRRIVTGAADNEAAANIQASFARAWREIAQHRVRRCDLDDAVRGAVSGIFAATGQTCIAGSRLLLQDRSTTSSSRSSSRWRRPRRSAIRCKAETQVGPVTTPPQYKKILDLHRYRQRRRRKMRSRRRTGDEEEGGGQYFVKPTIFTGVQN